MIDFHCHLDLYSNPKEIVRECVARGMYVLSVTTTPTAWGGTSALTAGEPRIRTALGLHPQVAHERKMELALFDRLLSETRYVGEVGLDGGPEFREHWHDQVAVFQHVLSSCESLGGRIISIHSRRAAAPVLETLDAFPGAGVAILHWYSGSYRDLQKANERGCWFSVGPSMVSNKKGMDLVARMPPDRVLTESDGPFATVEGRNALPWDVDATMKKLAELWGLELEIAQQHVRDNFRRLLESDQGANAKV